MDFLVCKFGGSSVATPEKLAEIRTILLADQRRRCVVVSAPGKAPGFDTKVTDLLIDAVKTAVEGNDTAQAVGAVQERFRGLYGPLGLDTDYIDSVVGDLDARLGADRTNKARYRDSIVASGEDYNARLFARYLADSGVNAAYVGPLESGLKVTDDFGDAQPLKETHMALASLKQMCAEKVVVYPGFFGITAQGAVATFSRGGSDLTGAILAEALDAVEYENWTDVDGIRSANPKIVDKPEQIIALSYKEMRELSYMGFNVFHEEAVKPVLAKKIPIRLRNTGNVKNRGTLIVSERLPSERDVVGIASNTGYCSFNLQKFLMNRERGFGRRLLEIFESHGLSYEHCPSGVDNMSVLLSQRQFEPETVNSIIRTIEDKLQPDDIKIEYGIALLVVVGEGLLHKIGVLSQATGALSRAGVNIKMANQGSSEISMIFGIDSSDEKKAVKALYDEFFK